MCSEFGVKLISEEEIDSNLLELDERRTDSIAEIKQKMTYLHNNVSNLTNLIRELNSKLEILRLQHEKLLSDAVSNDKNSSSAADNENVYITLTGLKYHINEKCQYLKSENKVKVSKSKAIENFYQICRVCGP